MAVIILNTLSKNKTPYVAIQQFEPERMLPGLFSQVIYFSPPVSGTYFDYSERLNGQLLITKYLVSQTPAQIRNMINPPVNWGYSSGISGTVTLSGSKKVKEITAIAQESAATLQINGGDIITLPYGSTDRLSVTFSVKPDDLIDPTIIFTGTKSYFIEYST